MKFLRYLSWTFRALLFGALFLLALKNSDPVTIRFYFDQFWQVPLVLVMLAFFVLGASLGVLACMTKLFAQRRELASLKRRLSAQSGDRVTPPLAGMGS